MSLSKITNLESLLMRDMFADSLKKNIKYLPMTIKELTLENIWGSTYDNMLMELTALPNLQRLTTGVYYRLYTEEDIKKFLLSMPQLRYASLTIYYGDQLTFFKQQEWFDFLRKNNIHADVIVMIKPQKEMTQNRKRWPFGAAV